MQITLSNRLEELYEAFKRDLYIPGDSLTLERLVVVPNAALRDWLQHRLASDPEVGIAAGIRFAFEDDAFARLAAPSDIYFPSHMQLSLALEADIDYLLQQPQTDPVWTPLFDYLKAIPGQPISVKTQRRLVALCEKLATLFRDYGKQAGRLIASWSLHVTRWQERLWQRLFFRNLQWSYPCKYTEPAGNNALKRVYLFGQIYLCPLYHRFFLQLSQQCSVKAYFFSACGEYWADVRSDRESARLMRHQQDAGASSLQQEALHDLLRDRNPLLANLGHVGRKMATQLDWDDHELDLAYQIPEQTTILAQLQTDLLQLNNPSQTLTTDSSIQIHIAPTRLREVEALYDHLVTLMHEHAIAPSDIQVLAPDIEPYAPLIKAVFGTDNSICFHMADLNVFAHDAFTDGFRRLISLANSRWEAPTVLELLSCAPMRQRYAFSHSDLQKIRDWMQQAGILWATDLSHRSELLKKAHCTEKPVSDHSAGTWNEGLGRLLSSLVYGHSEIDTHTLPISSMNWSDTSLLGKFIGLIKKLQNDLKPIQDGSKRTPVDWMGYLFQLCHDYLEGNSERLFPLLTDISSAGQYPVPFASIQTRLERALQTKRYIQRSEDGQAIRFGSIRSSSGVPAKVVCLLGLDENSFPMAATSSPLNLLTERDLVDDIPSAIEQDRQRFLDALLSARDFLIVSYTGLNTNDGKEQNPSSLITEFTTYLQRSYGIDADQITTHHPFYPFDKSLFHMANRQPIARYRAAQAHYNTNKKTEANFFETFSPLSQTNFSESSISLHLLETAAKNPLKLYCNQALGLYLQEDEPLRPDETFVLNPLQRYAIKQDAKHKPLEIALKHAIAKTILPQGLFGTVASQYVQDDFNLILDHVNPEQIFSVEFGLNTKQPVQYSPKHWLLPAIAVKIESQTIYLYGRIDDLSPDGWLVNGKGEFEDQIKAFPGSLLLSHIPADILPNRTILWAKNSKKTPISDHSQNQLETFVHYTIHCLQAPCPLIPDWIEHICSGKKENIRKSLEDERFFNQYAKWGCRNIEENFTAEVMQHWTQVAKQVYGKLVTNAT